MAGIDFDTIAGTKLYIADGAPTVTEGAGAAAAFALLTWVEFSGLTSIGSVEGREYSMATLSTVGDAQDREKKGSFKLPNAEFEFAWLPDDAGQILAKAASKNYTVPSFKLVDQDLGINYFTAQVSTFKRNGGTSNDALKGSTTLLRQTDTVTV
ncbi:hypothetical protein CR152_30040 [Massilia violaceinigra]|uniref:Phage tail protein n=1 Tax=Massilia violaceinigra TaxID=2045208 RepID=A0A2D2DTG6_9BURK|nr:hypothetical protein [Massilia violaceinigra]ATQ78278.1 hypothetical protein CR152_30040 [Massilia violaceinigra]